MFYRIDNCLHDFVPVNCVSCGLDYERACNKCGKCEVTDGYTDQVCNACYERLLAVADVLLIFAKNAVIRCQTGKALSGRQITLAEQLINYIAGNEPEEYAHG